MATEEKTPTPEETLAGELNATPDAISGAGDQQWIMHSLNRIYDLIHKVDARIDKVDTRLQRVERLAWIAIGIVGILSFIVVNFWDSIRAV